MINPTYWIDLSTGTTAVADSSQPFPCQEKDLLQVMTLHLYADKRNNRWFYVDNKVSPFLRERFRESSIDA
jgi:hypothetical protein